MKKIIRVTPDVVAYLLTNGEHHYKVDGGLEHGYKLSAVTRDPSFVTGFIFVFENNDPETSNELIPLFTDIGADK